MTLRLNLKIFFRVLCTFAVISCSTSKETSKKPPQSSEDTSEKKTKETATKSNGKSSTQTSIKKSNKEKEGDVTVKTTAPPEKTPNSPVDPTKPVTQNGEAFFTATIEPLFRASCKACHTDPRQPSDVKGPLTIYSYIAMKPQLVDGSGSSTNKLMEKVRGSIQHGGGDQCRGSLTNSPCKEITEWWKLEQGPGAADSGPRIGRLIEVTPGGKALGWAINPKNLDEQVMVKFYVGGPKETGTAAGSTTAFVNGEDEDTPGFHAFSAELPAQFRNGKQNSLFVYAVIGGVEQPLQEVAYPYTAWAPTAAGQTYFTNTVQPALNGCNGCHGGKNYIAYYASLFIQPPNKGGTAANNELINKTGGLNGVTHSGGNSCGGNANSGPCAVLQTWWQMEFGAAP